jgi:hypothetical protein
MLADNGGLAAEDAFSLYGQRIRWVKRWYELKIVDKYSTTGLAVRNSRTLPADKVTEGDFSFLDETF